MTDPAGLERSRQELAAARLLAEGGFGAQAVSRAYYAAFYAAEAALRSLGETRSKHSGVIAVFERLVVRTGGIEPDSGRRLRSLFRRRNEADYGDVAAPPEEAEDAINEAERFVDAVDGWLGTRTDD